MGANFDFDKKMVLLTCPYQEIIMHQINLGAVWKHGFHFKCGISNPEFEIQNLKSKSIVWEH